MKYGIFEVTDNGLRLLNVVVGTKKEAERQAKIWQDENWLVILRVY